MRTAQIGPDLRLSHTRQVILGFVAGGCRLINHNHHDSEHLELYFGVAIHGVVVLTFLGFLAVSDCRHTQTYKIRSQWNFSLWLQSTEWPSQRSMRGPKFLHFGWMCDSRHKDLPGAKMADGAL